MPVAGASPIVATRTVATACEPTASTSHSTVPSAASKTPGGTASQFNDCTPLATASGAVCADPAPAASA